MNKGNKHKLPSKVPPNKRFRAVESPSHPSPRAHTPLGPAAHMPSAHIENDGAMFDTFNWLCISMTVLQASGILVKHPAASDISTCPQVSHQSLTKCIPSFTFPNRIFIKCLSGVRGSLVPCDCGGAQGSVETVKKFRTTGEGSP